MPKKINLKRLINILESHRHWLQLELAGKKADLVEHNLSGLDLSHRELQHANLSGADLSRVSLISTNLSDADLTNANLSQASLLGSCLRGANLSGADLTDADLRWADLSGVILSGADLSGVTLSGANLANPHPSEAPAIPVVPNLDAAILAQIESNTGDLDMDRWHSCETSHCRAGWAIHLAGEPGYALERRIGASAAGALIYHQSTGYVPNFHASDSVALADIKAHATNG